MSDTTPSPNTGPSASERLGLAFRAFVRALVRLILIILVAGLIGLAIWLAVPRLYRQYVQPVQEHTLQIQDLRARQEQDVQQLNQRLNELQERLNAMDVLRDQDRQAFAELQASLEAMQGQSEALQAALDEQRTSLDQNLSRLDEVDTHIAEVDEAFTRLRQAVDELNTRLEGVDGEVAQNRQQLEALAETFADAENPVNSLRRELNLVKAMELITRSRLFLAQNNLGLMEQDLTAARDLLSDLSGQVPAYQQEALLAIVNRLDLAISNLPDRLDLVENDLEAAWQLLLAGLPTEPPAEAASPAAPGTTGTPEGTLTPTATADSARQATPTPTPSS